MSEIIAKHSAATAAFNPFLLPSSLMTSPRIVPDGNENQLILNQHFHETQSQQPLYTLTASDYMALENTTSDNMASDDMASKGKLSRRHFDEPSKYDSAQTPTAYIKGKVFNIALLE